MRRMHWSITLVTALIGCGTNTQQDEVVTSAGRASVRQSSSGDLLAARQGFTTRLQPSSYQPDGPAPKPPEGLLELVRYPSPVGRLAAYISPDANDGKRHPALLWAHGGFGGIGSSFWEEASPQNDQTARAFREAGIVLMIPSWRGENDNPGDFELFFGEVNDLLAARDYLAALPFVDAERIYVAGHSTGGTMVLLAVTASDKFRAAFSFGGAPDIQRIVSDGHGYGNTPFDYQSADEGRLRSAIQFVHAIKTPTFYFEGDASGYCEDAAQMEARAKRHGAPFTTCIIRGGDHFNILAPITRYLAEQILEDTGTECRIAITSEQANEVFERAAADYEQRRAAAVAKLPVIELTPAALTEITRIARSESLDLTTAYFRVDRSRNGWAMAFDKSFDPATDEKVQQGELTIVVPKASVADVRGYLIDYVDNKGRSGFVFQDRFNE